MLCGHGEDLEGGALGDHCGGGARCSGVGEMRRRCHGSCGRLAHHGNDDGHCDTRMRDGVRLRRLVWRGEFFVRKDSVD